MKKSFNFLVILTILLISLILLTGCSNDVSNESVAAETSATATTSSKPKATTINSSDADRITLEEAKQVALNHAGISEDSAVFTKAKLDTDNGIKIYEIDFKDGNMEYEYDINANTGEIISSEKDAEKVSVTSSVPNNQTSVLIPSNQAVKIALVDAGVEATDANVKPVDLDAENGVQYYDVIFRAGNAEYEYEINAETGEIISADKD